MAPSSPVVVNERERDWNRISTNRRLQRSSEDKVKKTHPEGVEGCEKNPPWRHHVQASTIARRRVGPARPRRPSPTGCLTLALLKADSLSAKNQRIANWTDSVLQHTTKKLSYKPFVALDRSSAALFFLPTIRESIKAPGCLVMSLVGGAYYLLPGKRSPAGRGKCILSAHWECWDGRGFVYCGFLTGKAKLFHPASGGYRVRGPRRDGRRL
jgi:hypothetical protein